MKKQIRKAFTLLEVMLSMVILSIIVYTVFIVFDRSIDALDNIFVDTQKYEAVRLFFDQISKELSSAIVDKTIDTDSYFRGGPHWIEFTTPLIDEMNIEDYIKTGVSGVKAPTPKKVQYYLARNAEYNDIFSSIGNRAIHFLFHHNLYRIIPKDNNRDNIFTYFKYGESNLNNIFTETGKEVPYWLDSYRQSERLKENKNTDTLSSKISIIKILTARALQFRYHYELKDSSNNLHHLYQDWWDSRLKYPSFVSAATGQALFNSVYDTSLYPTYQSIADERQRRYGTNSIGTVEYDINDTLKPPNFTFDEKWLYENESKINFLAFDNTSEAIFNAPPLLAKGYTDTLKVCKQDEGDDPDPWFQKPPTSIEVRVYLFDISKTLKAVPPIEVDLAANWAPINDEALNNAYKGEFFSIKIYMPTKSSYITNYSRDLIIE